MAQIYQVEIHFSFVQLFYQNHPQNGHVSFRTYHLLLKSIKHYPYQVTLLVYPSTFLLELQQYCIYKGQNNQMILLNIQSTTYCNNIK
ncbi:hypothetical protein pb186bvf_002396 [Paramecium bursaria]